MTAELRTATRTYRIRATYDAGGGIDFVVMMAAVHNSIVGDALLITCDGASKILLRGDRIRVGMLEASVTIGGQVSGGQQQPASVWAFPFSIQEGSTYQLLKAMTRGCGEGVFDVAPNGEVLVAMVPPPPPRDDWTVSFSYHMNALSAQAEQRMVMLRAQEIARSVWPGIAGPLAARPPKPDNTPPRNKDWEWENQP